jgi:two-component system sensor histidine kinase HydH
MPFAFPHTVSITSFDSLKEYVGFTDETSAALRRLHPLVQPHFGAIVEDFYRAIESHEGARAAITGGAAQIARLKQTLTRWLDTLLLGPHDHNYHDMRARIGRVHVRIDLPQAFMFTAMNRIRLRMTEIIVEHGAADAGRSIAAVSQILDLELAIMLETYREDLTAKTLGNARLATVGHFAASVGHELRNPLAVIESSLFLLRQHLGDEVTVRAPVAKHLNRIEHEVTRANKTIYDLLDLARNRPPQRTPTNVRALIDSAEADTPLPDEVHVQSPGVPVDLTIDVDPDQFRRVFVNLFINAAQAMAGQGTIEVMADSPSTTTLIRVKDDGPGVDAAARDRVFEALFTTKANGTGLGLALCRRILDAHGGTIELEPSDAGASFLITLPRQVASLA